LIAKAKALTKSKFVRNVAIVASGTAGAQVITMAFAPLITRLYGPEAFGLLGIFMAILAVVTPMAALTYPIAIVLAKGDAEAKGLAKLSMLLAVGLAVIALVLILLWGEVLAQRLSVDPISQYFWLIPFAMLFAALHQVLEQLLIRHKQFKVTARVAVIKSVLLNGAKVGAGLWYPLAVVLIFLQTLASGLHAVLLWLGLRRAGQFTGGAIGRSSSIKALAHKYRDFPMFRAPEVTIGAASQGLPVLMLAALFGPASAGFYTLGRTIMGIPAGLIGKSVGDVFYPRISEAANNREPLYPLVKKATLLLAAVGAVPFALVMAFGPSLFTLVFGAEWTTAGDYARWLALWMFFMFANNPSVKAIPVVKAQAFQLVFAIVTITLRLGALAAAYYMYQSDLAAVVAFSVLGALLNIVLVGVVLKKCKNFDELRG
jgi:O-antigen/teichoic acid export membrane protein